MPTHLSAVQMCRERLKTLIILRGFRRFKMDEIQKLLFVVDADTSPLDAKFSKVTQQAATLQGAEREAYLQQLGIMQKLRVESELLKKARDRANDPKSIQDYSKRIQDITAQTKQLTNALQPRTDNIFTSIKQGLGIGVGFNLVQGLQRAVGMMVQLTKSSLQAASAAENNRNAYKTMLGSRTEAAKLEGQIIELVKKSPLELVNANDYVKRLLAMGIAQKDVVKDLKSLGDVASGVGIEKMPQLILAFGQVKAAGKLMGGELRQFTEAGVPLLDEISKQAGKSTAATRKAMEDGKINFTQVRDAIQALTGENGRFFNLMEKQSTTLTGMLSNLSDIWTQLEVVMGEKFMPTAKAVVGALTDMIGAAQAFLAVPMSEKLQEEQTALNGLALAAISMNDNYETRSALINEIKQQYPEFLAGLDAETVSNKQLAEQLEKVNDLYRKRIALELTKEEIAPVQDKLKQREKQRSADREASLKALYDNLSAFGKPFDEKGYATAVGQGTGQGNAFLRGEINRAYPARADQEAVYMKIKGGIKNKFDQNREKELADLDKRLVRQQNELQGSELDQKRSVIASSKAEIDRAKKERDNFTKDSEEYKYYNGIVTRQETANKKLKIDYAKAEIERLDKEITTSGSRINGLEGAFNDATLNSKNKAQVKLDLADERAKYARLAKERAGFASQLPKELTDDPKADKSAASARDKAKRDADKLKEDRIKAKEDLAKELAKLNLDIAKAEDKDGYQTIERIKRRIEAEIKVEKTGLNNKRDDLVRHKIFTEKEAEELYAPAYAALKKKESLLEINEIKKFKEEARKVELENNSKLIELTLDIQTEKLNNLSDSLNKENKLIFQNADKQEREINKKYNDFRAALETDYKKGLLSIAETDLVALAEAARKYEASLLKINALETQALENSVKARDNALLVLNQKALDENRKASGELFSVFETGRQEGEAAEIQTETERYLRGQIRYEEFQKRITAIQKRYELNRKLSRIDELNDEINTYQKRIDATKKSNQGLVADPSLVLNKTDLEKANTEITRLRGELARLRSELAQTQAGGKADSADAFKEKVNKFIDGYAAITDAALNAFKTINDAELKSLDYSIDAQKNRIEQAKTLRDRGNTEILDEEEKRLRILDERRRRALARQQFLDRLAQLSSVAVGVAKAFADSGGKFTAVTIAASIAALVAGYSLVNSIVPTQTQRFAKGTPFVRRPMGVSTGLDTVPAMLTEGERVTDASTNKEYGESLDILTSRKMSAKEAKKRLTEDVDFIKSDALNTKTERRLRMNYERLAASNNFKAQVEARRSRADEFAEKQIEQNKEIIYLLRGNKSQVNLSLDRRGFALSVTETLLRESKRNR